MEIICVFVATFSLLAVGHSAPVSSCESLIQPLEFPSRDKMLGKWTYIAETSELPGSNVLTKMLIEGIWWNFTAAEQSDKLKNFQNHKTFGMCFTVNTDMTLSNNTLTVVEPYYGAAILLRTRCPDCLVLYSNSTIGTSVYKGLLLLSRRGSVSAEELEDFKKQVECLNMPSPSIMDPQKGLCPEETAAIDLTESVNAEDLRALESLLKSENGVQTVMKMFTSAISHFQQN